MVNLPELCKLFRIPLEGNESEDELVALLTRTVEALLGKLDETEKQLAAARSSTLTAEMQTLRATVQRLEQVVKTMPTEAERSLEHRRDLAYGRVAR